MQMVRWCAGALVRLSCAQETKFGLMHFSYKKKRYVRLVIPIIFCIFAV
jgi:hypothetical protein